MLIPKRFAFQLVVLSVVCTTALPGKPVEEAPILKVLARYTLPAESDNIIVDVRWARKDAIYLADFRRVAEVKLADGLPEIQQALPSARDMNFRGIVNLAVSRDWFLAVEPGGQVAWTAVDDIGPQAAIQLSTDGSCVCVHDIDARGDDAVLLGVPTPEHYKSSPGEVLWRSDLSKGLDSWEPLLKNDAFAKSYDAIWNRDMSPGSVRFLRKGGFVVAPNFQPGVMLFSSSGKLKKTWTPEELWGADQKVWAQKVRVGGSNLAEFLAAERVIDEVLDLPEGPAIVIREPKGRGERWRLGILGEEIRWYEIPVAHMSSVARLRGDVDAQGRIVLTGGVRELWDTARVPKNEVLVLALPD